MAKTRFRFIKQCSLWIWTILITLSAGAQQAEIIDRVKEATAYVSTRMMSSGSAVCLSEEDGYFLTCAHVVSPLPIQSTVSLTINPGLPGEKRLEAEIIRIDQEADLALLKAPGGSAKALPLGDSSSLKETDEVIAAGYPLGQFLAIGRGAAPNVTITSGKVNALRNDGNKLSRIQMDVRLNPGNSGGPVISKDGKVVGIAVSIVQGTGLSFAISTQHIRNFISRPDVRVDKIDPISNKDPDEPIRIPFELHFIKPPKAEPPIRCWLAAGPDAKADAKLVKKGKFKYELTTNLASLGKGGSRWLLRAELVTRSKHFKYTRTMTVKDSAILVGGKSIRLSEIDHILPKEQKVQATDGSVLEGNINGLDKIPFGSPVGNQFIEMNGQDIIFLRPARDVEAQVTGHIEVKHEGILLTTSFSLPFLSDGRPRLNFGDPSVRSFSPGLDEAPKFAGEKKVIKLPGEILNAKWGGGGRYLVAHIDNLRELAVVDCLRGEVIGQIPVGVEFSAFGAGAREILVAAGTQVERWSYEPLGRLSAPRRWTSGPIHDIIIGSSATQLAGIHYAAIENEAPERFDIRNLQTGRLVAIEPVALETRERLQFRASADGSVYSASSPSYGSAQVISLTRSGVRAEKFNCSEWMKLGVDGSLCYTGDGSAYLQNHPGGPIAKWPDKSLLPTTLRGVACKITDRATIARSENKMPTLDIVDVVANRELLRAPFQLEELGESGQMIVSKPAETDPLTRDKRIHFSPQLGIIATIPISNRSVVVRNFDLWQSLKDADQEFLYVMASIQKHLEVGSILDAKIDARSSSPDPVTFKLLTAPDAMTLDEGGRLKWEVPKGLMNTTHQVLIEATTQDGLRECWIEEIYVH